jgi:hypothetical protein
VSLKPNLRARLDAKQSPGVAKCVAGASKSAEIESRECAIEDLLETMHMFGISQRELARVCEKDLTIIQDWISDGRKRLPAWIAYRLPEAARAHLLGKMFDRLPRAARAQLLSDLIDRLGDSEPPSRTGSDG